MYISTLVDIAAIKCRKAENSENQRQGAFIFHLRLNNVRKRVCKKMFLQTLPIGEWSVQNWVKAKTTPGKLPSPTDVRKKSQRQIATKNPAGISFIIEFLHSLPKVESHYCRKDSTKLYLEPQWRNVSDLYRFYV